jgi:hypothetical protein
MVYTRVLFARHHPPSILLAAVTTSPLLLIIDPIAQLRRQNKKRGMYIEVVKAFIAMT